MNIPEKIKIGNADYKVELTKEKILEDEKEYSGIIDFTFHKIRISQDQDKHNQEEVFLHEVIHGILNERDVELEENQEEIICNAISKGMHQILKDNPGLFKKQEHRIFISMPQISGVPEEVQDAIKKAMEKIHL